MESLPPFKGKEVLERFTEVTVEGNFLCTPIKGEKAAEWSKALIEEGVSILEMNHKVPVLEDLFLQLTGGDPIE